VAYRDAGPSEPYREWACLSASLFRNSVGRSYKVEGKVVHFVIPLCKLKCSSFIYSTFHALIRRVKLLKKPKNALGFMNVILLHSNYIEVILFIYIFMHFVICS